MAGEQRDGAAGDPTPPPRSGWLQKVEDRWRKTREHAESYPYVWASYILVYGGLGVYITYRWRKLRQTEERVRRLQEELRKLVEAEEAAAGASTSSSAGPKPSGSSPSPSSAATNRPPSDKPSSR